MGQLEKGELSLEAGWREWDDVRKHSVLSQTLHNISTVSARNKSTNAAANPKPKGQQNDNGHSGQRSRIDKACSFYNSNRCFRNAEHKDKNNHNVFWMHICSWCLSERKDKARHNELDCPFKGKEVPKNGEGPTRGQ